MAKLTISMPDAMADYVASRVETGQYGNVSEYFRDLVRREQEGRSAGGGFRRTMNQTAAAYGLFQVVFADLADHLAAAAFYLRRRKEPSLKFEKVLKQEFSRTLKQLRKELKQLDGRTSESDSLHAVRRACDNASKLAAWRNDRIHARVKMTEDGYLLYHWQGHALQMSDAQIEQNIRLAIEVIVQLEGHMRHIVDPVDLKERILGLLSTLPDPADAPES